MKKNLLLVATFFVGLNTAIICDMHAAVDPAYDDDIDTESDDDFDAASYASTEAGSDFVFVTIGIPAHGGAGYPAAANTDVVLDPLTPADLTMRFNHAFCETIHALAQAHTIEELDEALATDWQHRLLCLRKIYVASFTGLQRVEASAWDKLKLTVKLFLPLRRKVKSIHRKLKRALLSGMPPAEYHAFARRLHEENVPAESRYAFDSDVDDE